MRTEPRSASDRLVETSLAGLTLLAVDDESDTLEMMAAVLRMCGAGVRTARSASEALDLLQVWHPDVLLSDLEMPQEDGYQLIAQVRERPGTLGRLPAIAVTAHTQDRANALAAGFTDFVAKPVNLLELISALQNAHPVLLGSVPPGTEPD
jgi:CheY-like chemotaxis protein